MSFKEADVSYAVYGVGNALVDIQAQISDETLEGLKFASVVQQIVFKEHVDAMKQAKARVAGLEKEMAKALPDWSLAPVVEALMALRGVKFIASDDHAGLKAAVRTWFPEADHQRCTVHVQRNVIAKAPRRLQKRIAGEVGFVFKAASKKLARERFEEFDARWSKELPEAVDCFNGAFEAATRFYEFPQAHWRRIHTTNSIERLNGEIKRRTKAVGAFPDRESALRLVANVAIRACARWGQKRYLDMNLLREEVVDKQAAA